MKFTSFPLALSLTLSFCFVGSAYAQEVLVIPPRPQDATRLNIKDAQHTQSGLGVANWSAKAKRADPKSAQAEINEAVKSFEPIKAIKPFEPISSFESFDKFKSDQADKGDINTERAPVPAGVSITPQPQVIDGQSSPATRPSKAGRDPGIVIIRR